MGVKGCRVCMIMSECCGPWQPVHDATSEDDHFANWTHNSSENLRLLYGEDPLFNGFLPKKKGKNSTDMEPVPALIPSLVPPPSFHRFLPPLIRPLAPLIPPPHPLAAPPPHPLLLPFSYRASSL